MTSTSGGKLCVQPAKPWFHKYCITLHVLLKHAVLLDLVLYFWYLCVLLFILVQYLRDFLCKCIAVNNARFFCLFLTWRTRNCCIDPILCILYTLRMCFDWQSSRRDSAVFWVQVCVFFVWDVKGHGEKADWIKSRRILVTGKQSGCD